MAKGTFRSRKSGAEYFRQRYSAAKAKAAEQKQSTAFPAKQTKTVTKTAYQGSQQQSTAFPSRKSNVYAGSATPPPPTLPQEAITKADILKTTMPKESGEVAARGRLAQKGIIHASLGVVTGVLGIASDVGKGVARTIYPDQASIRKLDRPEVRQAVAEAQEEIYKEISVKPATLPSVGAGGISIGGLGEKVLYHLPASPLVQKQQREGLIRKTITKLQHKGYSFKEAVAIANAAGKTEVVGGTWGELALGVGTSALAEKGAATGAKFLTKAVTRGKPQSLFRARGILTVTGATSSAAGGVFEGATQEAGIQASRLGGIKYPHEVAEGALFGGLSAGLIQAPISHFALTRPRISKGIYTAATIADFPYESAGDVTARKLFGETRIPITVKTPTADVSSIFTPPKGKGRGGRPTAITPTEQAARAKAKAQAKTPTTTVTAPLSPLTPTPSPLTPTPTPTQITPIIEGGSYPITPTMPTITETPTETTPEAKTQAEAETVTPTTSVSIPTQTVTPIIRGAPAPLPFLPILGARGGYTQKGRLIYYGELAQARQTMRRLI